METHTQHKEKAFVSTRNACKVCTPLGSGLAFKGIEGCVPLIHGSQGCATYIRRYMISHFKEPVDIASTNFSEETTIYGGQVNFELAVNNIISQYNPKVIAVSTTCLSETIGDDMNKLIKGYQNKHKGEDIPKLIFASTPSYRGTHVDGFHEAVSAMIKTFAQPTQKANHVNVFPGMLSCEDIRLLKEMFEDFGLPAIFAPDYSETLDNPIWMEYKKIPEGGTSVEQLTKTADALASFEFGHILNKAFVNSKEVRNIGSDTASEILSKKFGVPRINMGMPIGIKETDVFFEHLQAVSGKPTPEKYTKQRGRLIDAYVDGHKYVFGKKAIVYGEEDFVVGLTSFLTEIGIDVVLAASGGESRMLERTIKEVINPKNDIRICSGIDFEEIATIAEELKPDIIIGNSKGYYIARKMNIPIVRVGFPIHDRVGGQRIKHIGYEGTQELFDKVTNALIEYKQDNSAVGYKYM